PHFSKLTRSTYEMSNIIIQDDPEALLEEMNKNPPCEFGLSLEELLTPRKQKTKSQKPPRAQNKFILYRKHYVTRAKKENPQRTSGMKTHELSKEASQSWDSESNEVKRINKWPLRKASDGVKEEFEEYIDFNQCGNLTK
ncbi:5346_t:CDS:2, partial [Racocetra persica]